MRNRMKVLIVYDSKTGNTEKMAHAVAEGVKREGVEVDIRKVEEASVDKLLGADALHSRARRVSKWSSTRH
jgi:NAD(P)H dehydrogenase (quinone)